MLSALRPLLVLALPVLAEQVLNMLVGFVDTILTGRYLGDDAYMAAIGLSSYLMWLVTSIFSVIGIGATALIARLTGAGKNDDARHVANQAMLLGGGLGLLGMLVFAFASESLVRLLQLEGAAGAHAARYLAIIVPVIPLIGIEQACFASLRGAGDTATGMKIMCGVNLINMLLSYALAVGAGGLPRLGWDGLALGTAIGHAVGGTLALLILVRGRSGLKLTAAQLVPNFDWIRRLLRIGIPGGADVLGMIACHMWFLSIINSLGTMSAAAHGLAIRIESVAYLPGTAFHVAAATLVGQALGAQDPRRAVRIAVLTTLVGGLMMSAAGVVMFIWSDQWTWLFLGTSAPETARLAARLLRIVSCAMPAFAAVSILAGAMRGAGETRLPLVVTFIGLAMIRVPLAYLLAWPAVVLPLGVLTLPGCGLGVIGAWYAMLVDITVRMLLMIWAFRHGSWQRVRV